MSWPASTFCARNVTRAAAPRRSVSRRVCSRALVIEAFAFCQFLCRACRLVALPCTPDLLLFAPLTDREIRGSLQSREGPAPPEWLQLGPSTGSILPFGRRAGSHRAVGTCSSVNDQQCLAAVQALSGPRHGKTRIGSFCPTHLS